MQVRKIYRVEHRVSMVGPYRHDIGIMADTGWTWHTKPNGRPSPLDDEINIYDLGSEYLFGFASKKKLNRWFARFKPWLQSKGFVVVLYLAKPEFVQHGKHQVAFIPGRKLKTFEVSEILK